MDGHQRKLWCPSLSERGDKVLIGQQALVIGAGIGGLTAALALARRGAQVTVLEQAEALGEVGAGLQISPNGMAVLDALGLSGELQSMSITGKQVVLRDHNRGAPVLQMDLGAVCADHPWLFIHRADLISVLARAAQDAGVQIHFGITIAEVAPALPLSVVRLADGTELGTPLVVAADGVHGLARKALGDTSEAEFTGQTAWRALIPETGPADPVAQVFMGPGRHVVSYPLRGGTLRNVVAVREQADWTAEGWSHRDDPANMRAAFADFAPEVTDLLSQATEAHIWGLFKHPVATQWHKHGLALLGDSAHPTLPFLAQGACMALEDAWVLADCLTEEANIEQGLALYQARRKDRCTRIVAAADRNATLYHLAGSKRSLAHTALRLGGRLRPSAPLASLKWLYETDVTRS